MQPLVAPVIGMRLERRDVRARSIASLLLEKSVNRLTVGMNTQD